MSRKSLGSRRVYESVTFDDAPTTSMKEDTPPRKSSDPKIVESIRQWGLAADDVDGDGDIFSTPTRDASDHLPNNFNSAPFASFAGEKAKSMAQRINTVAQVVMTPCMAPNLSSMIAKRAGVSPPQRPMQGSEKQAYFDLSKKEHLHAFVSNVSYILMFSSFIKICIICIVSNGRPLSLVVLSLSLSLFLLYCIFRQRRARAVPSKAKALLRITLSAVQVLTLC